MNEIKCYYCELPIPAGSRHTAFCSDACWDLYNREHPAPVKSGTSIDRIKQKCKEKSEALKKESGRLI